MMVTHSVNLLDGMTESFFEKIESLAGNNIVVRKRLTEIIVELSQNIKKHSVVSGSEALRITKGISHFLIESTNQIQATEVEPLKNKVRYINSRTYQELKQEHTDILMNGSLSDKSGAGLGFYRIALRTKSELTASLTPVNQNFFTFTLHVNLPVSS